MIVRRPRNLKRDRAAAAKKPRMMATTRVPKTTTTLLRRLVRNPCWPTATRKLSRVGWVGTNFGVDERISLRPLKAVLIIQ